MGQYNGAVLTTAGQAVIAQAIAGGIELEFTRCVTSATAIPAGTDLTTLVAISDIEQSIAPSSAQVFNNNIVQISTRFTNASVATAYLIQTLGIYGQTTGGSETLIAVSTAITPDQMPAQSAVAPSAFIYNFQLTVQSADSLTVTTDDAGTATVEDLNTLESQIDAQKLDKNGDGENVTVTFDDSGTDPDVTSFAAFKNALVSGISLTKLLSAIKASLSYVAPKSHSSATSGYGGGSETRFGHVKLSDVYNSQIGTAAQSIGASQKAVYDAYTSLNSKLTVEKFYIQKASVDQTIFAGYGYHDKASGTVRIYVGSHGTAAVASYAIGVIPEQYRPSSQENGVGGIDGHSVTYTIDPSNGWITNDVYPSYTECSCAAEYQI